MTDTFLLLTPLLVLAIVALLGFVGCDLVLGLPPFIHPPTFTPPAGAYYAPQLVTLDDPEADEIHYYLKDPTDPVGSMVRHKYDGQPIVISKSLTIKADATKRGIAHDVISGSVDAKYYIGQILYQQGPAETSDGGAMIDALGGRYTPPFPSPLGAGNLVLVWVFYQADPDEVYVSGMSDGINKYLRAAGPTKSSVTPIFRQEIWYANNIRTVPGAVITVSFSISATPPLGEVQITAHEYTNNYQEDDVLADSPPEGTTGTDSNTTPGNLVSSGTVPATTARLAFGAAWFAGSGMAQDPPFHSRSVIRNNVVEDKDITEPGNEVTAVFVNTSPTRGWMAQIITLR